MTPEKPKRPRGRPKGTTDYAEPKVTEGHYMTQKAHKWVRANKEQVEALARDGQEPERRT